MKVSDGALSTVFIPTLSGSVRFTVFLCLNRRTSTVWVRANLSLLVIKGNTIRSLCLVVVWTRVRNRTRSMLCPLRLMWTVCYFTVGPGLLRGPTQGRIPLDLTLSAWNIIGPLRVPLSIW